MLEDKFLKKQTAKKSTWHSAYQERFSGEGLEIFESWLDKNSEFTPGKG